ncbi:Potassium transporter 5 [Acorus calamus]|uniref:Potassium transporter 5 n=1 Tax=Acorus calamus TaxID=4465 RepID=A0AAV9ER83_ACOCL|nr:Potassium transporter 5 [Acorus calamus]
MAEEVEEAVEGKEPTVDIESGGGDGDRTVEEVAEGRLRRHDSLLAQASKVSSNGGHKKDLGWMAVLQLAFQSIGIVYGDIGTSPLCVYASTFTDGIKHEDDILGVLSLIFYTITLITLVKYVFIVLRADGETFALYSLICRYAKVSLMPSQQAEDREVSNYHLGPPSNRLERRATKVKSELEKRGFVKYLLLFVTMLGTLMVIGDGVLTPCISVLSAVGGIKEATNVMTEGSFADVGHFTVRSVQISMCSVAFPSLILAYTGQASYLRHNMNDVSDTFYKSIPGGLYWPMFVVAVLAAIITSQAMISGTFSIIQQSLSLGCFPRVKIVHTSAKFAGKVYIPEVNYLLMLACVGVTAGIAVVLVMTLTSFVMVLIMIMIWKWHVVYVVTYSLIIGSIELVYLSSVLYKFDEGGYLPLAFAALLVATMLVWNYSYRKKYAYEYDHMVAPSRLTELVEGRGFARVPGMAFFYSELAHGVPPIFERARGPLRARLRVREGRRGKEEEEGFEGVLVGKLEEFIREEGGGEREVEKVEREGRVAVVHLVGESEVAAGKDSSVLKRVVIDYAYDFLRRNVRQENEVFGIPYRRLLKVGMTCEV